MKKYEIEEDKANAIIAYLQERPHKEVFKAVEWLTSLKEIKEDKEEDIGNGEG